MTVSNAQLENRDHQDQMELPEPLDLMEIRGLLAPPGNQDSLDPKELLEIAVCRDILAKLALLEP